MHKHLHKKKDNTHKKNILHRIKIIAGHVASIQQMIEDDVYCVDIIHQSIAVQKALKKLDMVIMDDHLRTCVIDQIRGGEETKTISELLRLYEMKE